MRLFTTPKPRVFRRDAYLGGLADGLSEEPRISDEWFESFRNPDSARVIYEAGYEMGERLRDASLA